MFLFVTNVIHIPSTFDPCNMSEGMKSFKWVSLLVYGFLSNLFPWSELNLLRWDPSLEPPGPLRRTYISSEWGWGCVHRPSPLPIIHHGYVKTVGPWGWANTTVEPELCQTKFRGKLGFLDIRSCPMTGCEQVLSSMYDFARKCLHHNEIFHIWSWKTTVGQSAWLGLFLMSIISYTDSNNKDY